MELIGTFECTVTQRCNWLPEDGGELKGEQGGLLGRHLTLHCPSEGLRERSFISITH